jgi:hypothetical protein
MAKNDHGIELEAYRWQEYQDETYGVKMQTAVYNANQESMAASAAQSNALIESETTTLYRNFGWNEFNSIKETGGFSISPDNFAGKQFWIGEPGLKFWMNTDFQKSFTASVTVPTSYIPPVTRIIYSWNQGTI